MRNVISLIALVVIGIQTGDASATGNQDPIAIRGAVEAFLQTQVRGLPGETSFTIGSTTGAQRLGTCQSLDVSMAPGAKAWGRTSVLVRCQTERSWSLFVPVHIRIVAEYLVTASPLVRGQRVTESDLAWRKGDLSDLPAGVLTSAQEALGKTVTMSIGSGQPLRADLLMRPLVIKQNQSVKVVSRGSGFEVTSEGKALTNGYEGEVVQIKLGNGQIVSGIAKPDGSIAVTF